MEGQPAEPLSKKAQKKLEAQKKKEEEKAKRAAEREAAQPKKEDDATSGDNFGTLPLNQSQARTGRVFLNVSDLNESKKGQKVLIRGRIQNSRGKGNLCFLLIRQRLHSVQAVLAKSATISKGMLKFATNIPRESIVDVEGIVIVPEQKIEATTQAVELQVESLFVVSLAEPQLPMQIEDASRKSSVFKEQDRVIQAIEDEMKAFEGKTDPESVKKLEELQKKKSEAQKYTKPKRKTRLDNRILDLRTQANQGIFKIQSAICQLFREFLIQNHFTEIHSPKLIAGTSEGGAEVFRLNYFGTNACLAQSPQLYKQMAICADMERVFEIAPVFRAENSFTHRHMCEFVGLDLEMAFNEHYHEVLDVLEGLFVYIFDNLASRFKDELVIISQQYPFQPLQYPRKTLRLPFKEGVALLRAAGVQMGDYDDLSTATEKQLGKIIKEKYGTDFYVLDKFPKAVRPFYTMPNTEDPNYSNSYDFFIRGEEIMSGAQRIHEPGYLAQRAQECGIALPGIQAYIDSFKYGAPPHGGGGIGLERVVMLYLGLKNIRQTSMFPRDPQRLTP